MPFFEVEYTVIRKLDGHPPGPRIRWVDAPDPDSAARKVGIMFDVKPNGPSLTIDRVRRPGPNRAEYHYPGDITPMPGSPRRRT